MIKPGLVARLPSSIKIWKTASATVLGSELFASIELSGYIDDMSMTNEELELCDKAPSKRVMVAWCCNTLSATQGTLANADVAAF